MEYLIVIVVIAVIFIILGFLIFKSGLAHIETSEKKAGRQGEHLASQLIKEILNDDDILLKNIKVSFDGKNTELDNLIINDNGVFIIEVKNYAGSISGNEDDKEWLKTISSAGTFYQKTVKNPIFQVKRQVNILSDYLKQSGIESRIEGYAFFLGQNSPVESKYILSTQKDIERAIHTKFDKAVHIDKTKVIEQFRGKSN